MLFQVQTEKRCAHSPNKTCSKQYQLTFHIEIPLRLSYSMTINKSLGQMFEGIFLPNPVFAHGQLYVAFSRVILYRARTDVKVKVHKLATKALNKEKLSRNIVYPEVL